MSIASLETYFNDILIEIQIFSFKKMDLKMSSAKWRPAAILSRPQFINTLRPRQNGRYFPYDIFKCIFLNGNVWIPIKIPLKFVPKGPINNTPALFQIMAWRQPGDKPLSETMMVTLLTHICVTRPQWINNIWYSTLVLIRYMCISCHFPVTILNTTTLVLVDYMADNIIAVVSSQY